MNAFKKIVACLGVMTLAQTAFANSAIYLPEGKFVDWMMPNKDGTYDIVAKSKVADEKYQTIKNVKASDLTLRSKSPINGIFFGWVLKLNKDTQQLEHCIVEDLFENGWTYAFCDLPTAVKYPSGHVQIEARRWNRYGTTQDFIASVKAIGDIKTGDIALLTQNIDADYREGTDVVVKALFANGKALVIENTFGNFLVKGPTPNAFSKLADASILKKRLSATPNLNSTYEAN